MLGPLIDPFEAIPKLTIKGIDLVHCIHKQIAVWKAEHKDSINGKLFLRFTVTTKGQVKDVVKVKEIGAIPEKIEKKAKRLLENTKALGSATFQGHPIEIKMVVPFVF